MCLTHTILDDPDISKPSSSGSSDTLTMVSLPTPPYITARVGVEAQPRAVVDLTTRRRRVPVQVVFHAGGARWHSRVSADARGGEEQVGGARHATDFGRGGFLTR